MRMLSQAPPPQECTYRKVWEDDGNIQRVEIEQTAMVFFKTIYTRMHVLQASPMKLSTRLPCRTPLASCLAYHLGLPSAILSCHGLSMERRLFQNQALKDTISRLRKPWRRGGQWTH